MKTKIRFSQPYKQIDRAKRSEKGFEGAWSSKEISIENEALFPNGKQIWKYWEIKLLHFHRKYACTSEHFSKRFSESSFLQIVGRAIDFMCSQFEFTHSCLGRNSSFLIKYLKILFARAQKMEFVCLFCTKTTSLKRCTVIAFCGSYSEWLGFVLLEQSNRQHNLI